VGASMIFLYRKKEKESKKETNPKFIGNKMRSSEWMRGGS